MFSSAKCAFPVPNMFRSVKAGHVIPLSNIQIDFVPRVIIVSVIRTDLQSWQKLMGRSKDQDNKITVSQKLLRFH